MLLQWKVLHEAAKIPNATTKTGHSQINTYLKKEELLQVPDLPPGAIIHKNNQRVHDHWSHRDPTSDVLVVHLVRHVWLCSPTRCSMPGFSILHLPEFAQTRVHWVTQPSHSLSPTSPPAFSLPQYQGRFSWIWSSHQMGKVLELQHQSFQWIFRIDFL